MKLIIHRGANEIGGSCVEIATAATRIIVDVGARLQAPTAEVEPQSRSKRPTDLPKVSGLFGSGETKVDAVLLSHAHGDHTGLVAWVNPEIPMYCSKGTSQMLMAGSIFAGQKNEIPRERQKTLVPGKPVQIGDIQVTGLSVDHSAYDSMAFLIEADGKRLLYSGDLRLHGRKPGMTRSLLKHIADKPVDVLLMEGTNFRETGAQESTKRLTEYQLEAQLRQDIKASGHLVLGHFSPQHYDRMITFFKATRDAGRTFVMDPYGAFVWDVINRKTFRGLLQDGLIRVYFNRSFEQSRRKDVPKLNRPFRRFSIDLPTILGAPERYTLLFRPSMLDLDFSGALPSKALCIHSLWSGYLAKPEYKRLKAAIEKAGGELTERHTSGHILADDIKEFVKNVNPRHVVPIHTTGRSEFQKRFNNVLIVGDGHPWEIV